MCNIVDENTSTVLSTLIGTNSCQFHAIILYILPKNDVSDVGFGVGFW